MFGGDEAAAVVAEAAEDAAATERSLEGETKSGEVMDPAEMA